MKMGSSGRDVVKHRTFGLLRDGCDSGHDMSEPVYRSLYDIWSFQGFKKLACRSYNRRGGLLCKSGIGW